MNKKPSDDTDWSSIVDVAVFVNALESPSLSMESIYYGDDNDDEEEEFPPPSFFPSPAPFKPAYQKFTSRHC